MLINFYFNINKCKSFPQQHVFIDTQSSHSLENEEQFHIHMEQHLHLLIINFSFFRNLHITNFVNFITPYLHRLPGTTLVASRSRVDSVLLGVPVMVIVSWTLKNGTLNVT